MSQGLEGCGAPSPYCVTVHGEQHMHSHTPNILQIFFLAKKQIIPFIRKGYLFGKATEQNEIRLLHAGSSVKKRGNGNG